MEEGGQGGCGGACGCEGCSAVVADAPAQQPESANSSLAARREGFLAPADPLTLLALRQSHDAWVAFSGWREHHRIDEVLVRGVVVERKESGCPLIVHPDFGPMPLDDERAVLSDGTTFSREDWDEGDGEVRHRGRRILVRKGLRPRLVEPRITTGDRAITDETSAWLAASEQRDGRAIKHVDVLLVDVIGQEHALPPGLFRNAVNRQLGRPDVIGVVAELRRSVRDEAHGSRRSAFERASRAVGAGFKAHPGTSSMWYRVSGLPRDLLTLCDREEVVRVCRARLRATPNGLTAPTVTEMCDGIPNSWVDGVDSTANKCGTRTTWQTEINAAINAYIYLEAGYDGTSSRGLSLGWNVVDGSERLTLGVFDNAVGMDPNVPAFRTAKGSQRVRIFATLLTWRIGSEVETVTYAPSDGHGTTCAGIAMGSIRDGQDTNVKDSDGREARSGLASGAAGYWCGGPGPYFPEFLGYVTDTGVVDASADWVVNGLDVVTCSMALNDDQDDEPRDDEARGLDVDSCAVTDAFFNKNLVVVFSAGNVSGLGFPLEMGAGAASPVAIPAGAMDLGGANTARGLQSVHTLFAQSSAGTTPDGRAYPLLTVPHFACGAPCAQFSASNKFTYEDQGATSGSAPRVAGALLLFKDWYVTNHGADVGNNPGRLIANLLNFGDGVAWANHDGSGGRVSAPAPGHGLGRMRMRLYEPGHMSGHYVRGSKAMVLREGHVEQFDLSGPHKQSIPSTTQRLRITLWWAEVNTNSGENKAQVEASLYNSTTGETFLVKSSGRDSIIRFDCACNDEFFPGVPHWNIWLAVKGVAIPDEERELRRDFRVIHVAWFWETGPDTSRIVCDDEKPSECSTGADISRLGPGLVEAGELAANLEAAAAAQPPPPPPSAASTRLIKARWARVNACQHGRID